MNNVVINPKRGAPSAALTHDANVNAQIDALNGVVQRQRDLLAELQADLDRERAAHAATKAALDAATAASAAP